MSKIRIKVHESTDADKFRGLEDMCKGISVSTGIPGLDSILAVEHLVRKNGHVQYDPPFYLRLGKKWLEVDTRIGIDQPKLCAYVDKVLDSYMLGRYKDIKPIEVRNFSTLNPDAKSAAVNLYSYWDNGFLMYRWAYEYKDTAYIEVGLRWSDPFTLKKDYSSSWRGMELECYVLVIIDGTIEYIDARRLTDSDGMDDIIDAIDSRLSNLPIVQGTLYDDGNFAQVGWWSTRNYKYNTITPKVKDLVNAWNTRIKNKYPDIADSLYVKLLDRGNFISLRYKVPEEVLAELRSAFEPLAVDLQGSDPAYVKV